MKFNWGTGITIAIIVFMGFILAMVFKITSTNADLYAKDYYNQEIGFQARIDAKNNANKLVGHFDVQVNDKALVINFPEDFIGSDVKGLIEFYRPNNADRDTQLPIKITNNIQSLDISEMLQGHYDLKIECENKGTLYYYEKPIVIH